MSLERISVVIERVGRGLAALCCAVLFLFFMADIVLRKLGISFLWPIEYNGFLMAFIVFLPLAGITRRREHLSADFFLATVGGSFERSCRRWLIPLANVVFCTALFLLAWRTLSASWLDETNSPGPLRTPLWIPQSVMVMALAATVLNAAIDLLRWSEKGPPADSQAPTGGDR